VKHVFMYIFGGVKHIHMHLWCKRIWIPNLLSYYVLYASDLSSPLWIVMISQAYEWFQI